MNVLALLSFILVAFASVDASSSWFIQTYYDDSSCQKFGGQTAYILNTCLYYSYSYGSYKYFIVTSILNATAFSNTVTYYSDKNCALFLSSQKLSSGSVNCSQGSEGYITTSLQSNMTSAYAYNGIFNVFYEQDATTCTSGLSSAISSTFARYGSSSCIPYMNGYFFRSGQCGRVLESYPNYCSSPLYSTTVDTSCTSSYVYTTLLSNSAYGQTICYENSEVLTLSPTALPTFKVTTSSNSLSSDYSAQSSAEITGGVVGCLVAIVVAALIYRKIVTRNAPPLLSASSAITLGKIQRSLVIFSETLTSLVGFIVPIIIAARLDRFTIYKNMNPSDDFDDMDDFYVHDDTDDNSFYNHVEKNQIYGFLVIWILGEFLGLFLVVVIRFMNNPLSMLNVKLIGQLQYYFVTIGTAGFYYLFLAGYERDWFGYNELKNVWVVCLIFMSTYVFCLILTSLRGYWYLLGIFLFMPILYMVVVTYILRLIISAVIFLLPSEWLFCQVWKDVNMVLDVSVQPMMGSRMIWMQVAIAGWFGTIVFGIATLVMGFALLSNHGGNSFTNVCDTVVGNVGPLWITVKAVHIGVSLILPMLRLYAYAKLNELWVTIENYHHARQRAFLKIVGELVQADFEAAPQSAKDAKWYEKYEQVKVELDKWKAQREEYQTKLEANIRDISSLLFDYDFKH